MVVTGDRELEFDSREGAWEMATTSKEGSKHENYPIPTQGGNDEKYQNSLKLKVHVKDKSESDDNHTF